MCKFRGLIFLLGFFNLSVYSQLDSIHWIPPLFSESDSEVEDHYLYLSTPSVSPINVTITDGGGTILSILSISKNNPAKYTIGSDVLSPMFIDISQLNNALVNKGLIVHSSDKFYANFRVRSNNQAGSLTAKGRAGKGTNFRVAVMPVSQDDANRNNFCSFMATENNTTITVTDYDPNVVFNGIPLVLSNLISFTLDEGESYVLSCNFGHAPNLNGIIGALVSADKPIVMNEGNYLGSLVPASVSRGHDACIDQAIPTNKIGKEYISIRGNGLNKMEQVLIVAHENGTDVSVNGTLHSTLNEGGWVLVNEGNYSGTLNENMYIEATKPVYAMQFLGGAMSPGSTTPGMNLLAPISCFLPNKVDLIPDVNRIGNTTYGAMVFATTLSGSTLTLNGIPQSGAEPVVGTNWETYKIPNLTGDISIESNNRLIGGVLGHSGAAGFSAYFSGFDRDPIEIEVVSDDSCGFVDLEVPETYTTYEWYRLPTSLPDDSSVIVASQTGRYMSVMTDLQGCIDTSIADIVVYELPEVDFVANVICEGQDLPFANQSSLSGSGTITNWHWEFGDGSTSIQNNPSHTYTPCGSYLSKLLATTDRGCKDSLEVSIDVHCNPDANFSSTYVCEGELTSFTDLSTLPNGSIVNWAWDFTSNNSIDNIVQNPIHEYLSGGSHIATLISTTDNDCKDTISKSIIVNFRPNVDFNSTNACHGLTNNFTNISTLTLGNIDSYQWDFGDVMGTSISPNTSYEYNSPGLYNVSLIATSDSGCIDSASHEVEVFSNPIADFTFTNPCDGDQVFFTDASIGNGGVITNINWDFDSNGSIDYTGANASHQYVNWGNYGASQIVTTQDGCNDTLINTITVYPNPEVSFISSNPSGCAPWCADFENTSVIPLGSIDQYRWDFGEGSSSISQLPSNCFANGTLNDRHYTITLTAISDQGCESTYMANDFVTVYPNPIADFTAISFEKDVYDPTIEFLNTSILGFTYQWNFGGLGSSIEEYPISKFPDSDSGTYLVCLAIASSEGCVSDTCQVVTIQGKTNVYVPTAFTPNGDGINDYFGPSLFGIQSEDYSLLIFDRWGELVFETDDPEDRWDGTNSGTTIQEGVYAWKLTGWEKYKRKFISKTGFVQMVK